MRNMTAAIEFGTSKVICVIGRAKSIGRFEVLGSGVAKYEGIKNGRWVKPSNVEDAVAKALDIAERKVRKRVKEAYIGVPGVFCKVICQDGYVAVRHEHVTSEDIEKLIDDAGDFYVDPKYTIVTSTPVYFLLDDGNHYIDVIGSKSTGIRGRVSFVLVRKQFIDDVTAALGELGVKAKAFIPEVLAESLFLVPTEERDCSAVLLNVGYFDTNVTVVYGDAIVYNKTIHAGGMHIANDLSIVMNMDVDSAEQIKKRYSFGLENAGTKLYDYAKIKTGKLEKYNHSMVSEVIDARAEHLCQLIKGAFEQSPIAIARRTRIFLSGGGLAMMKGAKDILQTQLKRQVRVSRIEAPQLSTPNYYAALALLDYVFESDFFGEGSGTGSLINRLSDRMYD
ncbi:MAG: cell division FtsA domain-containing protein [Eubacteriales bacterium]|nr:cell division FtsA domain-containing protein [Eubacteriales bacterium]